MLLWCTPSDFPISQLPFLPVAQKNVKNKTPSIAYWFFCILFQCVLIQLEQYLRRRKGQRQHVHHSATHHHHHRPHRHHFFSNFSSSKWYLPLRLIIAPTPPWHNVKPRLPLHPVRQFSVTTERIWRKKTVTSSIIIVFYLRKVWCEGVITTRGWCTCTGVSCTFFFFFCGWFVYWHAGCLSRTLWLLYQFMNWMSAKYARAWQNPRYS